MNGTPDDERASERETESDVERRTIAPDPTTSEYDLLEVVAELEGCDINDLPSLYDEVEHVVETLFRTPPSNSSQMEITFSYAGYRITIHHDGSVKIVPVKESVI